MPRSHALRQLASCLVNARSRLVCEIGFADGVCRSHAHKDLAGIAISLSELRCACRAHISRSDPRRPQTEFCRILRQLSDSVDPHKRKGWSIVLNADGHPRVAFESVSLDCLPVVNTMVPSPTTRHQTGVTSGDPSFRTTASFAVRVPSVRNA